MKTDHLSYWEKSTYLEGIQVCILGSGIVGLTTSIFLKKANPSLKILILERGYLPNGASTKNAGFACFGSPTEIFEDLQNISEEEVWDTVKMRWEGLHKLFELINPETIDYQPCGSWDLISDKKEFLKTDFLTYLNENILKITGINSVYTEDSEKIKNSGFQGFEKAYSNKLEGGINTSKMMEALLFTARNLGVILLNSIEVTSVDSLGTHPIIQTIHGEIQCEQLVITTNGFAKQLIDVEVEPARAQVLVTSPINNLSFQGTFHFDHGYYYFRNLNTPSGNRVLFGGARNLDFNGENTTIMETTPKIQDHLIHILKTKILPSNSFEIDYKWAGIMGVGSIKKPIIKEINPSVFVGVRMGGMGVAIGSLIGEKLSNLILNAR